MLDRIASLADYHELRRSFQWHCPDQFNFTADVIDLHASNRPSAPALHWVGPSSEHVVSFSELAQRSTRVAHALLHLGLKPGDRILVVLPRLAEWWETLAGILRAGMIAIPGTTLLTAGDIEYRMNAAHIDAVITDAAGAAKVDEIATDVPHLKQRIVIGAQRSGWHEYELLLSSAVRQPMPETRSDQPALIYFTSGTTGHPKMVLHTHASYGIGHQVTGKFWLDLHENDVHWNISDTGWAKAAWSSFFGPWICGACIFAVHSASKFQPADVLHYLNSYPITTMCAAPTIYRMLVQEDLSRFRSAALRSCVAAGEPLNPEVIAAWKNATGMTIRDGYGQTETVLLCGNFPGIDVKPGSMGLPVPGFEVGIVDDEGNPALAGAEGNIAVRVQPARPIGLFKEYFQNPTATAGVYRQGWYLSGDRARMDEDGYVWFIGRADDIILSSAYRIGPFEVESALIEHPAVVEAAVVGKPDPLRGEIVKAFVVLAAGFAASEELKLELQEHVKRTTAPYKYPREIEFLAELPKTVSGKIRRVELRQRP